MTTASSIAGSIVLEHNRREQRPMRTTSHVRATTSAASRSRSTATSETAVLVGILLPEPAAANALRRLAWGGDPA